MANEAKLSWEKAMSSIDAAELLKSNAHFYQSVSSAYYAMFHAAKSVLYAMGVEVKTHAGVRIKFGEMVIKPGMVPVEQGNLLADIGQLRILAEYRLDSVFGAGDAERACEQARGFIDCVRNIESQSSTG